MSGPPPGMKEVLVFPGEREVAGDPPRLEVDVLVPDAAPGAGVLAFESRAVNFKNNKAAMNGTDLGYLKGPGFGRAAEDHFEAMPIPAGVLRSGVNHVVFTAGANVGGGVGARHDGFRVGRLRVQYAPGGPVAGSPPKGVLVGAGVALVVGALAWAWRKRRKDGTR